MLTTGGLLVIVLMIVLTTFLIVFVYQFWGVPEMGVPPNHPCWTGFSSINHRFWGTCHHCIHLSFLVKSYLLRCFEDWFKVQLKPRTWFKQNIYVYIYIYRHIYIHIYNWLSDNLTYIYIHITQRVAGVTTPFIIVKGRTCSLHVYKVVVNININ